MRISAFIISLALIGLIASVLTVYIGGTMTAYGVEYNETRISTFDRYAELESQASQINTTLGNLRSDSSFTDVLGGLVSSGFSVIQTTWTSLGIFSDIFNDALDLIPSGAGSYIFRNYLLLIMFVVFMFALIGILIGRTL